MASRILASFALSSALCIPAAVVAGADKAAPAKPVPVAAGAAPVAPVADFTTPKGALKALYGAIARGDAAGIERATVAPTRAHERLRSTFAAFVDARARLRDAVGAKFGKEVVPVDADVPDAAAIDAAGEKIKGDRAAVELESANGDVVKVKGEWKSAVLADLDKEAVERMLPPLAVTQARVAEMKAASARVADGTVGTADEARLLLAKYPLPFSQSAEPAPGPPEAPVRR